MNHVIKDGGRDEIGLDPFGNQNISTFLYGEWEERGVVTNDSHFLLLLSI